MSEVTEIAEVEQQVETLETEVKKFANGLFSEVNRGIIFDDPVNSLDNDRKKQIAERLAFQTTLKQVIIFTHDLVFFYHIKNFSKKFLSGIIPSSGILEEQIENFINLKGQLKNIQ